MADAMESIGQDMHEEPFDKLLGGQYCWSPDTIVLVVPVLEFYFPIVHGDKAVVADGDSMGVTAYVANYAPGCIKGRF